ncbi:unnamed protein product [Nesidiocoris tenuis]|uniref:Uncharacterized protein n=1 Tax=Nesidiocoris tenuis TaxID=355587 RepID=A0A6H5HK93_9HEMI|nr:unnamed protein product [Nesidiocoris tenuis]
MAADSGMDTSCPSPENADSRKRPLDSDVDDGTAKKSNCSSGEWTTVSCVCRGPLASDGRRRLLLSLGGRGWQGPSIIATLETMEYTTSRFWSRVVQLAPSSAKVERRLLNCKKKQMPASKCRKPTIFTLVFFSFIPNIRADMFDIREYRSHHGGVGIHQFQNQREAGSFKSENHRSRWQTRSRETGDFENNKKACAMILSKVQEDPQSGSSLNISYADIPGPVANFNPTGSPYAHTTSQQAYATAALTSSVPSIDGNPTANGVFGPIGGATARTVMDLALEPFRHSASGPNSPPHLNNNSFSLKSAVDEKKDLRKACYNFIFNEKTTQTNGVGRIGYVNTNPDARSCELSCINFLSQRIRCPQ